MAKKSILFLVHPGSSCRSGDDNLGKEEAAAARSALSHDLDAWDGGIIVIEGYLSRDLGFARYRALGDALVGALDRAKASRQVSRRYMGCDFSDSRNQVQATQSVIRRYKWSPLDVDLQITGAWFDPSGDGGCVNDVVRTLLELGYDPAVRAGAVHAPVFEVDLTPTV